MFKPCNEWTPADLTALFNAGGYEYGVSDIKSVRYDRTTRDGRAVFIIVCPNPSDDDMIEAEAYVQFQDGKLVADF